MKLVTLNADHVNSQLHVALVGDAAEGGRGHVPHVSVVIPFDALKGSIATSGDMRTEAAQWLGDALLALTGAK